MEVIILPIAAGIFSLVGMLFDETVKFSLHTAYIFSLSPAINLGWVIIRDVANIFFIFVLIYISLGTIVKGTVGFHTKDLLTKVIIAALLINFSLFITKAVIDTSNVFGNWLYNGVLKTLEVNKATGASKDPSLSDLINARLGIIQFWSGGSNATANTSEFIKDAERGIIGQFIRLSIVLIAIYIFAYCAIMFLARSITLLFLMVFSPIGFMGGVLPQLEKYAKDWKNELVSAAIFPIVFLLMLYISLQFINSLNLLNITSSDDRVGLYFHYFIIIFLLHATLKVAKENSGEMGKALVGMADSLGKFAVGAAGGGAALLGKVAIGGTAARIANNTWLNQKVAGGGIKGLIAGGVKGNMEGVADYHFDTRSALGLGIKADKGYSSMMKDATKRQETAQKDIAAKWKEEKPAKKFLGRAEVAAYREHDEYGNRYEDLYNKINDETNGLDKRIKNAATPDERNTLVKERDALQKELNKVKSAINDDDAFEIQKKILKAQEDELELMKDRKGYASKEEIEAMVAAMRQGRVAKEAESGFGMNVAQTIAFNPLSKKGKEEMAKFKEAQKEAVEARPTTLGKISESAQIAAAVTAGAAAFISTLGLGRFSAKQYTADNKKIAGKLRDTMKEGEKKKNQEKIKDIIAGLGDGGSGGETPPAATGGGKPVI